MIAIEDLRINGERLWDSLMQLARIGATQADEWVAKAGEEGKRLIDAYRAAIA